LTDLPLFEKEFIHTTIVKQGPTMQNVASYEQLMNTTMNDTDDDFDSRRLLTNKVNTSTIRRDELINSGSNLTNITNVTPLPSFDARQQFSPKSSDYENLSNSAINDILTTHPQKPNFAKRNPPPVISPKPPLGLPPVPKNFPPQLLSQFKQIHHPSDTDDTDSMMSAQLISSANLLLNRENVREAKRVPVVQNSLLDNSGSVSSANFWLSRDNPKDAKRMPIVQNSLLDDSDSVMSAQLVSSASLLLNRENVKEAKRVPGVQNNVPPPTFNPRTLKPVSEMQRSQDANVQSTQIDSDANKPPPMETAI
jgi:hypothetical protein